MKKKINNKFEVWNLFLTLSPSKFIEKRLYILTNKPSISKSSTFDVLQLTMVKIVEQIASQELKRSWRWLWNLKTIVVISWKLQSVVQAWEKSYQISIHYHCHKAWDFIVGKFCSSNKISEVRDEWEENLEEFPLIIICHLRVSENISMISCGFNFILVNVNESERESYQEFVENLSSSRLETLFFVAWILCIFDSINFPLNSRQSSPFANTFFVILCVTSGIFYFAGIRYSV